MNDNGNARCTWDVYREMTGKTQGLKGDYRGLCLETAYDDLLSLI